MAALFKVPPQGIGGDIVVLSATPYGDVALARGDRVFLWWSESHGGTGLAGHGLCLSSSRQIGLICAEVEPIVTSYRGFGRAQLRAFRNRPPASPVATLAAKLYRHAHNKVVAITRAEEQFLDRLLAF